MEKGLTRFQAGIRSAVRGLWQGTFNIGQFASQMFLVLEVGLDQAWEEGAKECGILPEERTVAETAKLNALIANNKRFVTDFGRAIIRGSKANEGLLRTQMTRAGVWANRYTQVVQEAKTLSCADQKLKWVIDPTKDNCSSCVRLNGKVKRASFWDERSIIPQVPDAGYLVCRGFNCGCTLKVTDERVARGPLPNLP